MSRKLQHTHYERLKSFAADLIEDYELSYPLQPLTIADLVGVKVTVHSQGLPAAAWYCGTDDGYTEVVQSPHGLKHQIHLNGTKPAIRQRFTTMHEIGHVLAEHLVFDRPLTHEVAEAEANFLAGYLLAPDALINAWVPELTIAGVAGVFQISVEAARLAHARVIRAKTRNVLGSPNDVRILAAATRRVDLGIVPREHHRRSA